MRDMESHECVTTESRVCKDCGTRKTVDSYYRQTGGTLFGACKDCCKLRDQANYLLNREKRLAQCAARRAKKRDAILQYSAKYYLENKAKILAQMKEYRTRPDVKKAQSERSKLYYAARSADVQIKRKAALLKDAGRQARLSEYQKKHYEENYPYHAEKAVRRRVAKVSATPPWANLAAIRKIYLMAIKLSRDTGIPHHVDHVIPLKGRNVCGLHVENNLQVLPAKQNLSKCNKFIEG